MTPPTPAEQIARFIERHPGEWRPYERPHAFLYPPEERIDGYLLIVNEVRVRLFVDADGALQVSTSLSWRGEHAPHLGIAGREAPPLVSRIAVRVADSMQILGGTCDTLPSWLADPVRRVLRTRAGELLTLAGSSPADAVSAAETLDEALCQRAPVAATFSAVLAALQAIGMSCRWIVGADIPEIDYLRGLELNLKATCRQRDALLAAIKQAVADLDAYSETDKGVRIATLPARAALRRVLGVM